MRLELRTSLRYARYRSLGLPDSALAVSSSRDARQYCVCAVSFRRVAPTAPHCQASGGEVRCDASRSERRMYYEYRRLRSPANSVRQNSSTIASGAVRCSIMQESPLLHSAPLMSRARERRDSGDDALRTPHHYPAERQRHPSNHHQIQATSHICDIQQHITNVSANTPEVKNAADFVTIECTNYHCANLTRELTFYP